MFDWLRNLRKTEEDKQREQLTAYIDDELSAAERQAFERELADNDDLRATVEAEQQVKLLLSQAPRLRAPRNFTLDPAVYGVPQRPSLATRLYPQLRAATAVMAVLLVGVISLELLTGLGGSDMAAPAENIAQTQLEEPAAEPAQAMDAPAEVPPMTMAAESAPAVVAATAEPVEEMEEMAEMETMEEAADEMAADAVAIDAEVEEVEIEIQEAESAEEAAAEPAAGATAEDDEAAADDTEEADMEMADDGDNTVVAPRPEPTPLPDTRVEEIPAPTATPLPTPTIEVQPPTIGATVAPIPPVQPEDIPRTIQLPFWRTTQIVIALATAVLLGLTLYFRRRL